MCLAVLFAYVGILMRQVRFRKPAGAWAGKFLVCLRRFWLTIAHGLCWADFPFHIWMSGARIVANEWKQAPSGRVFEHICRPPLIVGVIIEVRHIDNNIRLILGTDNPLIGTMKGSLIEVGGPSQIF